MPKCINGGYALWELKRNFILIVKVREIKVVVCISIAVLCQIVLVDISLMI